MAHFVDIVKLATSSVKNVLVNRKWHHFVGIVKLATSSVKNVLVNRKWYHFVCRLSSFTVSCTFIAVGSFPVSRHCVGDAALS